MSVITQWEMSTVQNEKGIVLHLLCETSCPLRTVHSFFHYFMICYNYYTQVLGSLIASILLLIVVPKQHRAQLGVTTPGVHVSPENGKILLHTESNLFGLASKSFTYDTSSIIWRWHQINILDFVTHFRVQNLFKSKRLWSKPEEVGFCVQGFPLFYVYWCHLTSQNVGYDWTADAFYKYHIIIYSCFED